MAGIATIAATGIGIAKTVADITMIIKRSERRIRNKLKKPEYKQLKDATETFRNIQRILDRYIEWYHNFTTLSLSLQKLYDFIRSNYVVLNYKGNDPKLIANHDFSWKVFEMYVDEIARLKNTTLIRITKDRAKFFSNKDKRDITQLNNKFNILYGEFRAYKHVRKVSMLKRRSEQLRDKAQSMEGIMRDCIDSILSPVA